MQIETVTESIDVEGSPDACLAVVTDFEAWPRWEKNTKRVQVLERDEAQRGTKVWFEFWTPVKRVPYTVGYDYSQLPGRMTFERIDGEVAEYRGAFDFHARDDGTTRVDYEIGVHPGFPIPELLRRQIQRQHARHVVRHIKRTIQEG
jgi:uncharacterized membrane protein